MKVASVAPAPAGAASRDGACPVPALRTVLEINKPETTAGQISAFLGIDASLGKVVHRIRPASGFNDASDVVRRMLLQHQHNIEQGFQAAKDFDKRLSTLEAALERKKSKIIF